MLEYTNLKLGKLPATPDPNEFKLASFLDRPKLPRVPKVFGHQSSVSANGWGMLGNDQVGDCVWAGAAHETILWALEGGAAAHFTDTTVMSDYSKVTGYTPTDPNSDRGTDMKAAAKYRRQTGILDKYGHRHQVAAYLGITPDNLTEYAEAVYLFGAVGLGIQFPGSAMDQFNAEKPWDVVKGATIEGGHYVPIVGRLADGDWIVVTWGRLQRVTPRFIEKYADEALAYLSHETLSKLGKTPEGFDAKQLQADLAGL